MSYILALDQGTTSSRAIVFDNRGKVRASAQKEFRQIFPQPGWVEHDPEEIWSTQCNVAHAALKKAGAKSSDIAAIGIANQRETTVLWERKTGRPVHNAIVWQDRRTADHCARLKKEGLEVLFKQKTGLVLDPYFSGTKLAWLLDYVPQARQKAKKGELLFGTIDTWLAWNLSAGKLHITDVSNASRTLLFNIHTSRWDEELLKILNIPHEMLPQVHPSSKVYGTTAPTIFNLEIPLSGISGDQQSALFGQTCVKAGTAKNTYGTGCFLLMHTGNKAISSKHGLLTTCAAQINSELSYALEGSVFIGGAVVQWLRDSLQIIRHSADIEKLAASVAGSEGVYFVPALTGLGAPHWNPYARGTLVGLTRGTTRAHIARAALEAIAFQSADVLMAMQKDSGITLSELRVDGGVTANNLLMQFQADLLDVPVVRPRVVEITALGAAYLAGLAVGFWKNTDDIAKQWQVERLFEPRLSRDQVLERIQAWNKAVELTLSWKST